jgi:Pectate lyase superfamily protein/Right handed beta helix region
MTTLIPKFKQPFSSASNRPINLKLEEVVSVKDFGATGDGTTNDYAAITAAFATGKSVYFPVGTYLTGSPLNLPQNVVVWGEGNLSVITGSGNMSVIQSIGTSRSHTNGTVVRDLKITRTAGVTGSPLYQPFTLTFADNVKFQNVTFSSAGTYGGAFIAMGCSNLEVTDCLFDAVGCNVTSSDGTSAGTWSSNSVLRNCRMAGAGQGFDIYYTTNTLIEGCIASGSTSTYGCGFVVEYQNTGVTFTDCVAYGHVRSGFYYEPEVTNGIKDVSFNNCIGYGNGEAGLYMQNGGGVTITGGAYYSNTGTFGSGNGMGIVTYTCPQTSISNVSVNNNVGSGIVMYNGYLSNISNCVIFANGAYGINFTNNPPSGVNLLGNNFQGNTSGTVNGWNEFGSYWDLGGWVSYTPTFYKNDGTTTFVPTSLSVKFKRLGTVVHVVGSFSVNSGVLAGATTFVSMPYVVAWTGSTTGNDAQSQRGSCRGSATGVGYVDSIYYNSNICLHGPSSTDTLVAFDAVYEISGQ